MYVLNGKVVLYPDGTGVDKQESDDVLYVQDVQTGKLFTIAPNRISELAEATDPQTVIAEREEEIAAAMNQEIEQEEGAEGGTAAPKPTTVPETAGVDAPQGDVSATQQTAPTYESGTRFTLDLPNGSAVNGVVLQVTPDGVEVQTSSPVNGRFVQVFPTDEFDGMLSSVRDEEGDVIWSREVAEPETEAVATPQQEPQQEKVDNQGNPLNEDGTLKIEKINSIDELTDDDFTNPTRNVQLPALPQNVDNAIGANGKPVIIKRNIFAKNWDAHKFPFNESRNILKSALYNTDLVGQSQPSKKPFHWVAIKLDEKSPIVVLEVNERKDFTEIVGWYTLDERNYERIKRQAIRNGGELVMLSLKDKVESLSTPHNDLSSESKDTSTSRTLQGNEGENAANGQQREMQGNGIPVDAKTGEPVYDAVAPDVAWDAIVQEAEGDEAMAMQVVTDMVADMEAKVQKAKKAKVRAGRTVREKLEAQKKHKRQIEEAEAQIEEAEAQLEAWRRIAAVKAERIAAAERAKIEAERIAAAERAKIEAADAEGGTGSDAVANGQQRENAETEPFSEDTVGGSPVALAYLLEGGVGSILNAGYFLHGVAAAYPKITNIIERIRATHKEVLGLPPLEFVQNHPDIVAEIEKEIQAVYGQKGVEIYRKLCQNASGFYPRQGVEIGREIESLENAAANDRQTEQPKQGDSTQAAAKEDALKPIGKSIFGNIYDQFKGKVKEAFDFLLEHKSGDLLGVFHRKGVGDIDLIWGDNHAGLAHIINKHIGNGKSFSNMKEFIESITDIINNGNIDFENGDKIVFKKGSKLVTIRTNIRNKGKKIADKNWILTAYDELSADGDVSAIAPINKGQAARTTGKSTSKDTPENRGVQTSGQENAETSLQSEVTRAEQQTNAEPTEGQKEAGNYKKGRVKVGPFDVVIEQPRGSVRSGVDANGKAWETTMQHTYGYFGGTKGVDGDAIDVFLGNDLDEWDGTTVFVVDQYNPDGSFDEHKVMLGFNSQEEAEGAYFANYEADWAKTHRTEVTAVPLADFTEWVNSSKRKTKAFAEYKVAKRNAEIDAHNAQNEQLAEQLFSMAKESETEKDFFDHAASFFEVTGYQSDLRDIYNGVKSGEIANARALSFYTNATLKPVAVETDSNQRNANDNLQQLYTLIDTALAGGNSSVDDVKLIRSLSDEELVLAKSYKENRKGRSNKAKIDVSNIRRHILDEIQERQNRKDLAKTEKESYIKGLAYFKKNVYPGFDFENYIKNKEKEYREAVSKGRLGYAAILKGVIRAIKEVRALAEQKESANETVKAGVKESESKQATKNSKAGENPRKHAAQPGAPAVSTQEATLRDALVDVAQQSGLEVVVDEKAQQVLDEVNGRARFNAKQKRALETASLSQREKDQPTVVSSADGANVLKKLDILATDLTEKSNRSKTFLGDLANALGASTKGSSSQYATFETINGQIVTIRLANHNASTKRMDDAGRDNAISIVISPKPNEGILNDGDAHIVEFYYNSIKLRKAEGHPLAEIVRSIKQALYSGEYKDTTGLADVIEVNNPRFFRTPGGEAYGFTVDGKIYLDPRIATAETPIHEYAHLWADMIRNVNAEAWNDIVGLMKATPIWEEVRGLYPELKTDDEIADEVLAHYSGRRGAERLREAQQHAAAETGKSVFERAAAVAAIERVKQALAKFWQSVAELFHIRFTSAEEVADRVLADMLNGVNPNKVRNSSSVNVAEFAAKHHLNQNDVKKYADAMKSGNLGGASYAFKNIKRSVFLANEGMSLGQFLKVFKPIKKELFSNFGNVEELREEHVQEALNNRNVMEAARKREEAEKEAERKRLEEFELMSDEALDEAYMEAVRNNDEQRMRDLVNEAARRKGYQSTDEFRMSHRAPSYDEDGTDKNLIEVAHNKDNIRDSLEEQFRMNHDRNREESVAAISQAIQEIEQGKNPTVTIYRAVPKSLKEGSVRNGDWVTLSEAYAKQHGRHALNGDYRIMKENVPAANLYWDGNDINEWGYDDKRDYKYKDTRNNRKLNDLIVRDDKGAIIPLSKRFNTRKKDVRFQFVGEKGAAALDKAEEATTRLDNLGVAREMESQQKDAKAIKLATGWERGGDGKWRYEIVDGELKKEPNVKEKVSSDGEVHYETTLGEILDNEELYRSYPELRMLPVSIQQMDGGVSGIYLPSGYMSLSMGLYRHRTKPGDVRREIEQIESTPEYKEYSKYFEGDMPDAYIGREDEWEEAMNEAEAKFFESELGKRYHDLMWGDKRKAYSYGFDEVGKGVILHEVQHAIQHIEGFAMGGNSTTYREHLAGFREKYEAWSVIDEFEDKSKELGDDARPIDVYNALVREYQSLGLEFGDGFAPSREAFDKGFNLWTRGYDNEGYEDAYNEYQRLMGKFGLGEYNNRYDQLAGEVEERNVQKRLHMTPEERRQSLAEETEDVAREDQIFIMDGIESANSLGDSASFDEHQNEDLKAVNERFNEQLDEFVLDNADKINFDLGTPSEKLLLAGVADRPIRLHGSKVAKKMKKHGFAIEELRDLPRAVANPIAVFDNLGREGNRSVLTELRTVNGNFLVTIDLGKGTEADFDIVSSVFGKRRDSVAGWINKGYMRYVDKEKALNYLHLSAPIAEASDKAELSSATKVVKDFVNPQLSEENKFREGKGELSDDMLSYLNDPMAQMMGKPRGTKKQRAQFAERERGRMQAHAEKLVERLHLTNVEIVTDASQLEGKQRTAKGFYNKRTGKITIVLPNHASTADVEQTLLHEAVAHYGLRQLFGEHFDDFLDMVYRNAEEGIRRKIAEASAKHGWNVRTATEEYLADLAERTDFEHASPQWWAKIKGFFLDMLRGLGFEAMDGQTLTDNELRYVLWRSYENLTEPGKYPTFIAEARDVAKQHALQVGRFAPTETVGSRVAENEALSEEEMSEILFRDGSTYNYTQVLARDRYERRIKSGMYQTQEALQDSMLGLRTAMESILEAEGRKGVYIEDIDGFENAYLGENRLSSVNQAEAEKFAREVFAPMLEEVSKLAPTAEERAKLIDYLFAKHGLERNEVMARRAAAKEARKEFEKKLRAAERAVAKQKRALETASLENNSRSLTVVSSADGANVQKELDIFATDLTELSNRSHTFWEIWHKLLVQAQKVQAVNMGQ